MGLTDIKPSTTFNEKLSAKGIKPKFMKNMRYHPLAFACTCTGMGTPSHRCVYMTHRYAPPTRTHTSVTLRDNYTVLS